MTNYAAEPVPAEVDSVTSSYLDRQFNAIQTALMAAFIAPKAGVLPERGIPGAIIYIENETDSTQNGLWGCVADSQGEGIWKKFNLS
jgi:hypothetical protein